MTIQVVGNRNRSESNEKKIPKSNFDEGPQKILNQLKADRLERSREQKNVYKKLVIHLSQVNRSIEVGRETNQLEVQPHEVKLATCFQVVLNGGWSITKENWEDMLELSGIAAARVQYWDLYNMKKDDILARDIEEMQENFLNSNMFTQEEKEYIRNRIGDEGLESVKQSMLPGFQTPQTKKEISEEFIIVDIPDEMLAILQTALLLQVELGIDLDKVEQAVPRVMTEDEKARHVPSDTTFNSKQLLCSVHIGRLIAVLEKMGDKASMTSLLKLKQKPAIEVDIDQSKN